VSRRNRIFLGILVVFVLGFGVLLYRVANDLDARYRESTEESLVDIAHLLAAMMEADMRDGQIEPARLGVAFRSAYRRRFAAQIYGIVKHRVDLRAYVTDANGTVLFDSSGGNEGSDFRAWRDVNLALAGSYGARTTPDDPARPETAVMYVAAPIHDMEGIVGVVAVGKPVSSHFELVATARQKLLSVGLITVAAFVVLLLTASVWLVRPFGLTADLLALLRRQGWRHPGRFVLRARALLAAAYGDMRDAVAGRSYTEEYVQALTHEIKSPLAAIRGAAELLREPMAEEPRQRFVANIEEQTQRLQDLADRLLELASVEKRRTLDDPRAVEIGALVSGVVQALEAAAAARRIRLDVVVDGQPVVVGDAFLLGRALANLVANAIDFAPVGSCVAIAVNTAPDGVDIRVRDHGPGIPDYALDRVFERFYSLRRPDTGRKSTGLGLPFVREIAHLHSGEVRIANHPGGGAEALLRLPREAA